MSSAPRELPEIPMDHLRVTHAMHGTTVECTHCGVEWHIEPGAPMVARLDAFADVHMGCRVNRRAHSPQPVAAARH